MGGGKVVTGNEGVRKILRIYSVSPAACTYNTCMVVFYYFRFRFCRKLKQQQQQNQHQQRRPTITYMCQL